MAAHSQCEARLSYPADAGAGLKRGFNMTETETYDPFEFEDCEECCSGLDNHTLIEWDTSNYGTLQFYKCKQVPA